MTVSLAFCRRSLLISAVLLVAVALVVAAAIIPPVRVDTFPLATPDRAVAAFWVEVVFNVLAATVVGFIAIRTTGRSRPSTFVLGLLAFLVLLFGYGLTDAALAFRAHGPALHAARMSLFFCSATDLLAALLVIATAFLLPKRT